MDVRKHLGMKMEQNQVLGYRSVCTEESFWKTTNKQ